MSLKTVPLSKLRKNKSVKGRGGKRRGKRVRRGGGSTEGAEGDLEEKRGKAGGDV